MKLISILIVMNFLYAGSPAFTKLAGLEMDPLNVVLLRHFIALLCFLPFFLSSSKRQMEWRDFGRVIVGALLAFTLASTLQVKGMQHTQATDGAFIMALEPIAVIALAILFLKEKMNKKMIFGLALALSGFLILSSRNLAFKSSGNFLFLLAIFCEASFPILLKPLLKKYPPITVAFYSLLCATLYLLPFQYASCAEQLQHLSPVGWASVFYLGLGISFAACLMWLTCLKQASVSLVALSWFIQPLFGCLFAFFMLQERMTISIAFGGTLIFSALFVLGKREKTTPSKQPATRNQPRVFKIPELKPGWSTTPVYREEFQSLSLSFVPKKRKRSAPFPPSVLWRRLPQHRMPPLSH